MIVNEGNQPLPVADSPLTPPPPPEPPPPPPLPLEQRLPARLNELRARYVLGSQQQAGLEQQLKTIAAALAELRGAIIALEELDG